MRKFLKHVAHRLIGESAYASGTGPSGVGTSGLANSASGFGSRRHASRQRSKLDSISRIRHYSQFSTELKRSGAEIYDEELNIIPAGSGVNQASASRVSDDERTLGDDDSERGIVETGQIKQTTVVTITKENK